MSSVTGELERTNVPGDAIPLPSVLLDMRHQDLNENIEGDNVDGRQADDRPHEEHSSVYRIEPGRIGWRALQRSLEA